MRAGRIALALAFAAAGAFGQDIASLERWTVDSAGYAAHNTTIRRGETRILEPTFTGYDLTAATNVTLRYRSAGMTNYWPIAGEVYAATSGTVRVRWTPEHASTQTVYSYEIAVQSSNAINLRAFGQITLQPGIGSSGSALPAPGTDSPDWSWVTNAAPISANDISSVDAWTVDTTKNETRNVFIRSGETRILQVTHSGMDLTAATAVSLRYKAPGMTNHYYAAGEVYNATAGVVRVKLTPAHQGQYSVYAYEIAVISSNATLIKAVGNLTWFQGIGQLPAITPKTGSAFDWLLISEHLNLSSAPFPTTSWVEAYVAAHSGQATGVTWGTISGSITNQEDLINLLANIPGTPGPTGTAATVSISNVYTLASDEQAFVTNAGTPQAAALIIGIPRGQVGGNGSNGVDGAQGAPGVAGTNATIAVTNAIAGASGSDPAVTNLGSPEAAILQFTIPRGIQGEQGLTGNAGGNGTNGAPGTNATLSLATTVTGEPGTPAAVTNTGTPTAAILQFTIPRGADGTNGTNGTNGAPGQAGAPGAAGAGIVSLVTPYTIPSAATVTVTSVMVTNFPQGEAVLYPTNTFLTFDLADTNAAGIWAISCHGTNGLTIDSNACYGAAAVIDAWTNSATLPNEILIRKQSGDPKPYLRLPTR